MQSEKIKAIFERYLQKRLSEWNLKPDDLTAETLKKPIEPASKLKTVAQCLVDLEEAEDWLDLHYKFYDHFEKEYQAYKSTLAYLRHGFSWFVNPYPLICQHLLEAMSYIFHAACVDDKNFNAEEVFASKRNDRTFGKYLAHIDKLKKNLQSYIEGKSAKLDVGFELTLHLQSEVKITTFPLCDQLLQAYKPKKSISGQPLQTYKPKRSSSTTLLYSLLSSDSDSDSDSSEASLITQANEVTEKIPTSPYHRLDGRSLSFRSSPSFTPPHVTSSPIGIPQKEEKNPGMDIRKRSDWIDFSFTSNNESQPKLSPENCPPYSFTYELLMTM